jgi:hypothetical protein
MKNTKNIIYISISSILGLLNAFPSNNLSNLRSLILLIAEAFGFMLGAYIISSLLTLVFSIFDKSILKRFISISLLITMIILIIVTIGTYLS